MKKLFAAIAVLFQTAMSAQELFPNSEPASIVPKNALGVRLMNEAYASGNNLRSWHGAMFMYGISSKLMLNAMFTTSNHHRKVLPREYVSENGTVNTLAPSYTYLFESVNLGFRYRFVNIDADHAHFRMAAYGNAVYSNLPHDEAEVTLMGDNKGVGGGIISTVLLNKLAISFTGGMIKPFTHNDASGIGLNYGNAYNYSLSFGYLVYPRRYKNYGQTNINLYAEFLGKSYEALEVTKNGTKVLSGHLNGYKENTFVEFRPAVQFIVKSNLRLDFSTAFALVNQSYIRKYPSYMINIQYYFFL
jgi:hypothetical protein